MRSFTPSYTTKNRFGIYVFQYRIPSHFRHNHSSLKVHFRKSLLTRNRRLAVQRARKWIVLMDEIAKKYFHSPELYKAAMQLLAEHEVAEDTYEDWTDYEENFLSALDEDEDKLLERAIYYKRELISDTPSQLENNRLKKEIATLKNIIETKLSNNDTSNIHEEKYTKEENPALTELFNQWQVINKSSMRTSSFGEFCRMIDLFIRIINDKYLKDIDVASLNEASIRHYKDILQKIPKGTITKDKPITELVKLSGASKSQTTIYCTSSKPFGQKAI